ncbi:MAG: Zn-ribbon domain-containing OB-fold protein [Gammaproteobacteria bacterium]
MKPIAENLFEQGPEGAHLLAGRDKRSGRLVFPLPQGAASADFGRVRLSRRGRLWSWTVQRFRPKPPFALPEDQPFAPYAVGYVELADELIVESRLRVDDFGSLRIGQAMELVVEPLCRDAAGEMVATYAFRPVQEAV